MSRYTITVSPDNGRGATAVVQVDMSGSGSQVKTISFHAGTDGSLSTAGLPPIDAGLLLAAIMPGAAALPTAAVTGAAEPATSVAVEPDGQPVDAAPTVTVTPVDVSAEVPATRPAPAARSGRATRRTAAARTAKPAAPVKETAPQATAGKSRTGRAASKPVGKKLPAGSSRKPPTATVKPASERVYRSMPEDFAATYNNQASTVAALADVYQVPRHTAQGWILTARKRGLIPAARSRSNR